MDGSVLRQAERVWIIVDSAQTYVNVNFARWY